MQAMFGKLEDGSEVVVLWKTDMQPAIVVLEPDEQAIWSDGAYGVVVTAADRRSSLIVPYVSKLDLGSSKIGADRVDGTMADLSCLKDEDASLSSLLRIGKLRYGDLGFGWIEAKLTRVYHALENASPLNLDHIDDGWLAATPCFMDDFLALLMTLPELRKYAECVATGTWPVNNYIGSDILQKLYQLAESFYEDQARCRILRRMVEAFFTSDELAAEGSEESERTES